MGNGGTGGMGQWVQGVWAIWAMGTHGQYRVWHPVGISHMGNRAHGTIGYRGYGVQGYGQ